MYVRELYTCLPVLTTPSHLATAMRGIKVELMSLRGVSVVQREEWCVACWLGRSGRVVGYCCSALLFSWRPGNERVRICTRPQLRAYSASIRRVMRSGVTYTFFWREVCPACRQKMHSIVEINAPRWGLRGEARNLRQAAIQQTAWIRERGIKYTSHTARILQQSGPRTFLASKPNFRKKNHFPRETVIFASPPPPLPLNIVFGPRLVVFLFSFAIAQQAAREMGVIDDVSEVRLFAV